MTSLIKTAGRATISMGLSFRAAGHMVSVPKQIREGDYTNAVVSGVKFVALTDAANRVSPWEEN